MIQKLKYKDYVMEFSEKDWKLSNTVKQKLNAIRQGSAPDQHNWLFKV